MKPRARPSIRTSPLPWRAGLRILVERIANALSTFRTPALQRHHAQIVATPKTKGRSLDIRDIPLDCDGGKHGPQPPKNPPNHRSHSKRPLVPKVPRPGRPPFPMDPIRVRLFGLMGLEVNFKFLLRLKVSRIRWRQCRRNRSRGPLRKRRSSAPLPVCALQPNDEQSHEKHHQRGVRRTQPDLPQRMPQTVAQPIPGYAAPRGNNDGKGKQKALYQKRYTQHRGRCGQRVLLPLFE